MYQGEDPVARDEDSYFAVINNKLVAPCAVSSDTETYWASHTGFAKLMRYLQATRGNGIIEQMAVPISSPAAQRAIAKGVLLWEGLV
jgi:hypothetical protein